MNCACAPYSRCRKNDPRPDDPPLTGACRNDALMVPGDPSLDIENVNAYARQMQERAFAAEAEVERMREALRSMPDYAWRALGVLIAVALVGATVGICLLAGMDL